MAWTTAVWLAAALGASPEDSTLKVDAGRVVNRITPWMYGSCIEDVNHEIYGGLYAQRIFGESFEEPPASAAPEGWSAFGGRWQVRDGALAVEADRGAKAVRDGIEVGDGVVSCSVRFGAGAVENAGLILRVQHPRVGADAWTGYEVSLYPKTGTLMLGRHQEDFRLLKQVLVPGLDDGRWHRLKVAMAGPELSVWVDAAPSPNLTFTDAARPLPAGLVGVRTWGSDAEFREVAVERAGETTPLPLAKRSAAEDEVSGAWDAVRVGEVAARFAWDADRPFNTDHSQRIDHGDRPGVAGVANRGLNRQGLTVRAGRTYEGHVYLRQKGYAGAVTVALQSADGTRSHAERRIEGVGADWSRHAFALKPAVDDENARFAVTIDVPGTAWVDQAYLCEGGPGLFQGQPIRADLARGLQDQGLTLLRYGGCMVNAPGYRWKAMIGDRDRRPQYRGWWYPQTTNGFGIEEFIVFCRAAGFEPVVAVNVEETPEDLADLVEYLNGAATSPWGRRRAANGHREPYGLRYLQLGNEEKTDAHYLDRFNLLYEAIRPKDPGLRLIIAAWWEPDNPVSRRLVRELDGKAALWDVHVGADDPRSGAAVDATFSRMRRLVESWAPGTALKAVVLEENGGRHDLARALGHAGIVNATQRHGDFVLMDCPANCLQAWRQNDNDWDQGQLFYQGDQVWGMPNYHAQRMAAGAHQSLRLASEATSPDNDLDLTATTDAAGSAVVLKVVNAGAAPHRAAIVLEGLGPVEPRAEVTTLTGSPGEENPPEDPGRILPRGSVLEGVGDRFSCAFPAYSYTILRLRRR